jgi:hypothetical protein
MQYQTFRSVSDVHVFVLCSDGSFYERGCCYRVLYILQQWPKEAP